MIIFENTIIIDGDYFENEQNSVSLYIIISVIILPL